MTQKKGVENAKPIYHRQLCQFYWDYLPLVFTKNKATNTISI